VKLTDEAKGAGAASLINLDDQGHQLARINGKLVSVDSNLRTSETTLKSMERLFFGLLPNVFKWNANIEKTAEYKTAFPVGAAASTLDADTDKHEKYRPTEREQRAHRRASLSDSNAPPADSFEAEYNENLDVVGDSLKDLKQMAILMSSKLDSHKSTMCEIDGRMDVVNKRLKSVTKRTTGQLN